MSIHVYNQSPHKKTEYKSETKRSLYIKPHFEYQVAYNKKLVNWLIIIIVHISFPDVDQII